MKPPPFDYMAPRSLEEALTLLSQQGDSAKVLAGGQSLVPLLNFRLAQPAVLVDINRIQELSYLRQADGGFQIGALTRQRALETSSGIRARCPMLAHAAGFIGHLAIRNRGTLGGSLAHADPAAELPLVVTVLGGRLTLRSREGARSLAPEEFFLSYLTTALRPTELLVEVWVPALGPRTGWGFRELALQHGAFAIVAAGALLTLDGKGICREARLALGGVNPVPTRVAPAESLLRGEKPSELLIREAAHRVKDAVDPTSDIHASAEYRAAMAEVYARRALQDAWARARQGT